MRYGEKRRTEAKALPIGFMKQPKRKHRFVISRQFLKYWRVELENKIKIYLRIISGNQSNCFCSNCSDTNSPCFPNHAPASIFSTWQNNGNSAYDNKAFPQRARQIIFIDGNFNYSIRFDPGKFSLSESISHEEGFNLNDTKGILNSVSLTQSILNLPQRRPKGHFYRWWTNWKLAQWRF